MPKENSSSSGSNLEIFYSSISLPTHMRHLLTAYGIEEVEDLQDFGQDAITAIEEGVRDGTFAKGFISLTSKQEQKRYFGAPIVDLQGFSFRANHSLTLKKISQKAKLFSEAQGLQKASEISKQRERSKQRSKQLKYSSGSVELSQSSTSVSTTESFKLQPRG